MWYRRFVVEQLCKIFQGITSCVSGIEEDLDVEVGVEVLMHDQLSGSLD